MIHHVFDWQRNNSDHDMGWLLRGQPHFDTVIAASTLAHDTVEHFPACYGAVEDECIALGALVRGRGLAGVFEQNVEKLLGSELIVFVESWRWKDVTAPPSHTGALRGDGREGERIIQEALDYAIKKAWVYEEWTDEKKIALKEVRLKLAGWLRIGYRRCERRYYGATPGRISKLFAGIEESAKKFLIRGEIGDTLHLSVCPRTLDYSFKHKARYA
jgi:hypothetical protein